MNTTTLNLSVTGYARELASSSHEEQTELLTVKEACSALRVSKWTLYRFIRSRQLTTVKVRSRRLIPRSAIQELIKKLEIEAIT
jgi:excisionase family DNA binding protein